MKTLTTLLSVACLLASCSSYRQISKSAGRQLVQDAAFQSAHLGVSIFEPATGKYLYNYQGEHYFVPASNTKLPTCYAAMKYLGDSLDALDVTEYRETMIIRPTGDPTLLHPDFKRQPAFDFLKNAHKTLQFADTAWQEQGLGAGWGWSDYSEDYLPERSAFPVYGDLVWASGKANDLYVIPAAFRSQYRNSSPGSDGYISAAHRAQHSNEFYYTAPGKVAQVIATPFITSDSLNLRLLADSLHLCSGCALFPGDAAPATYGLESPRKYTVRSQPLDSMLKLMMHRSDNFFAEQSLLMVSNKILHVFNDQKVIDTLLKTDFRDLPQAPLWADGSGLSRYNLFTPQDFVAILNKMQQNFGMDRIKTVFATGGTGTLARYFKSDAGYIFAKTGSLNGVVALSGFLYTKKNHLLIFSIQVNNTRMPASAIRKAEEKFLGEWRNRY